MSAIRVAIFTTALLTGAHSTHLAGQSPGTAGACVPVVERAGRPYGCFILATVPIGPVDRPFWHVESFPSLAVATQTKSAHGFVHEAFGKVWLLTIAQAGFRSPGGTHVAEIGPLPTRAGAAYSAQYMEAVFLPGMKSAVHRHAGPEAWYTLTGETCLETPQGIVKGIAGGSHVIVPEGPPMELTATGSETRRSLVLILHDSGQPPTTPAPDWTPKGLCKG